MLLSCYPSHLLVQSKYDCSGSLREAEDRDTGALLGQPPGLGGGGEGRGQGGEQQGVHNHVLVGKIWLKFIWIQKLRKSIKNKKIGISRKTPLRNTVEKEHMKFHSNRKLEAGEIGYQSFVEERNLQRKITILLAPMVFKI